MAKPTHLDIDAAIVGDTGRSARAMDELFPTEYALGVLCEGQ